MWSVSNSQFSTKCLGAVKAMSVTGSSINVGDFLLLQHRLPSTKNFNIFCSLTAIRVDFLKPLTDLEVKEKESARFECEISRPNVKVRSDTF